MSNGLLPHWQLMKDKDPVLFDKVSAYRTHLNDDQVIPRKYKELVMLAMCAALRFNGGTKVHAQTAMQFGATKEEVWAIVAQSITVGGISAYWEAANTVKELLDTNS
jgi:alkylhydroperoxidase/carboxymuconolactone decarboxylase family protein YurZ